MNSRQDYSGQPNMARERFANGENRVRGVSGCIGPFNELLPEPGIYAA
jgi:hypothetical protein